jgi:hypothetical protein
MIYSPDDVDQIRDNFDFFDFGCKIGSSSYLCKEVLSGKKGLGIDINPEYVNAFARNGGDIMLGDITNLQLPNDIVDFCCISHVLEHLPSIDHVNRAIEEALRLSRNFVYIVGPYFDADIYLRDNNLKFFWSDWTWHPTPVKCEDIINSIKKSGIKCKTQLWGRILITESNSQDILPLSAPNNQHYYDPESHGPKNLISFDIPLFKEISAIIIKNQNFEMGTRIQRLKLHTLLKEFNL